MKKSVRRVWISGLMTVVIVALVFAASKDDYYRIINQAYKTSDYAPAIPAVEKAVKEYPDEPNFQANLLNFYMKQKEYEKALLLAEKAYKKFPGDKYITNNCRWVFLEYGWNKYNAGEKEEAFRLFTLAYDIAPENEYVMNAYGVMKRNQKQYDSAISILEKGWKRYPENKYLRLNLAWTYYEKGDEYWDTGKQQDAYRLYQNFFQTSDKSEESMYTAYVYKLINLKKMEEGEPILKEAIDKFGLTDGVYRCGFWLYFHNAQNFKEKKQYPEMIEGLKTLYRFASRKELPDESDKSRTYAKRALNKSASDVRQMISDICPYWRKFTAEEKTLAYRLLGDLNKDLPPELGFIAQDLKGLIFYREGRVEECKKELDGAYATYIKQFNLSPATVVVPFPLKGVYRVGHYESATAVTHMGFNRYCYDIFSSDESGKETRSGNYDSKDLNDYLAFGQEVYSVCDGEVDNAEGNNPDDIPQSKTRGGGNYVFIRDSTGKIYLYFHFKQYSVKVKKGDKVKKGQVIGQLGNSQSSTPHLHFGVYSPDWVATYPVAFSGYEVLQDGKSVFVKQGSPGHGKTEIVRVK